MQKPSIAICCLREDGPAARVLAGKLVKAGAEPWLVRPPAELGDDWENLLETAVRSSDAMVVCLRPGFEAKARSQEEVRTALRVNRQAPFGPNFLIPFILEPVPGDTTGTIEALVQAVNLQCASQLKVPGAQAASAPPARLTEQPGAAAEGPNPPRGRSQAFSASPPSRSRVGSGFRVALGSLLIILVVAVGYWYWPEGKTIEPSAGDVASSFDPAQEPPPDLPAAALQPVAAAADAEGATTAPPSGPVEGTAAATPGAETGDLGGRVEKRTTPNQSPGRAQYKPEAIVIHSMDSGQKLTEQWQTNPKSGASMHYAIGLNGEIVQYVQEVDTAFHLGRKASSAWPLFKPDVDPNLYTIGIDHESLVGHAWPENQIQAAAALIRRICQRWNIPIDRQHILGHQEAFPLDVPSHRDNLTVKPCPGDGAPLDRLVRLAAASGTSGTEAPPPVTEEGGVVTAIANLKIRSGAPDTTAVTVRTAEAGSRLRFVGWTEGRRVANNPYWYRDPEGNFFWAGGTSRPNPASR